MELRSQYAPQTKPLEMARKAPRGSEGCKIKIFPSKRIIRTPMKLIKSAKNDKILIFFLLKNGNKNSQNKCPGVV